MLNIPLTQGEHPKHKGVSDAARLGTVERYFVEIMDIPRLRQRIQCFIFTRTFSATVQRVCPLRSF
jgi:formin 2